MSLPVKVQAKRLTHKKTTGLTTHASFILLGDAGVTIHKQNHYICHYPLFSENFPHAKYLFIYFGDKLFETHKGIYEWCNWVINESFLSDAFITKDVEEGRQLGFQIDLTIDAARTLGAIVLLRQAFEIKNWGWGDFKKLGFSNEEAFVLSTNFNTEYVDGYGVMITNTIMGRWHCFMPPKTKYSVVLGENYTPCGKPLPHVCLDLCGSSFQEQFGKDEFDGRYCVLLVPEYKYNDVKKTLDKLKGI